MPTSAASKTANVISPHKGFLKSVRASMTVLSEHYVFNIYAPAKLNTIPTAAEAAR
jgi:hypothetical protein